jgi:hypothetical protein
MGNMGMLGYPMGNAYPQGNAMLNAGMMNPGMGGMGMRGAPRQRGGIQ